MGEIWKQKSTATALFQQGQFRSIKKSAPSFQTVVWIYGGQSNLRS